MTEKNIEDLRAAARDAKKAYENAVAQRSNCQREVNELLQRKSNWTEADVVRFTALVRQDHLNEQAEVRTKEASTSAEQDVEKEFNELMRTILNRYHEEQVWSDKIRSASTYGSLAALGLNLVVFILAIVLVEPWKRKRLAQTFERKIVEMSRENQVMIDSGMATLREHFDKQEAVLATLAAAAALPSHSSPAPSHSPENSIPILAPLPATDDTRTSHGRKFTSWIPIGVSDRDLIVGFVGTLGGFALAWFCGR